MRKSYITKFSKKRDFNEIVNNIPYDMCGSIEHELIHISHVSATVAYYYLNVFSGDFVMKHTNGRVIVRKVTDNG